MPRKPPPERPDALEGELIEGESISYSGGHPRQHLIDPLAPMPGGVIKLVKDQRTKVPRSEKAASQQVYRDYLANLVRYAGDGPQALSTTLGISLARAQSEFAELHNNLLKNVTPRSISEVLKEIDLHKEARLAILKQHAYGSVPAASLKAIDMLNDMDSVRSQDDTSYEAYIRAVQDKKSLKQP